MSWMMIVARKEEKRQTNF